MGSGKSVDLTLSFESPCTLRRSIEALDQLCRILAEEALAVHDANVGVAAAV